MRLDKRINSKYPYSADKQTYENGTEINYFPWQKSFMKFRSIKHYFHIEIVLPFLFHCRYLGYCFVCNDQKNKYWFSIMIFYPFLYYYISNSFFIYMWFMGFSSIDLDILMLNIFCWMIFGLDMLRFWFGFHFRYLLYIKKHLFGNIWI